MTHPLRYAASCLTEVVSRLLAESISSPPPGHPHGPWSNPDPNPYQGIAEHVHDTPFGSWTLATNGPGYAAELNFHPRPQNRHAIGASERWPFHLGFVQAQGDPTDLHRIAGVHHDGHVLDSARSLVNHYDPAADMTSFHNQFINHHPEVHAQLLREGGDLLREMATRTEAMEPFLKDLIPGTTRRFATSVREAADHFDVLRDHLNDHNGNPESAMRAPYHRELISNARKALNRAASHHEDIRGLITPDDEDDEYDDDEGHHE